MLASARARKPRLARRGLRQPAVERAAPLAAHQARRRRDPPRGRRVISVFAIRAPGPGGRARIRVRALRAIRRAQGRDRPGAVYLSPRGRAARRTHLGRAAPAPDRGARFAFELPALAAAARVAGLSATGWRFADSELARSAWSGHHIHPSRILERSPVLHDITVTQFTKMLHNLSGAWTRRRRLRSRGSSNPAFCSSSRLAPDQFHLLRQIQVACDTAKTGVARLTGKEAARARGQRSDPRRCQGAHREGHCLSADVFPPRTSRAPKTPRLAAALGRQVPHRSRVRACST